MSKQINEVGFETMDENCPACGRHAAEWKSVGYQKNEKYFCCEVCAADFFQI